MWGTPTPPISIDDNNISSTSTVIDSIPISKFHFTHVIKVLQGTNLLQSDNESTAIYSNSIGNLTHFSKTPISSSANSGSSHRNYTEPFRDSKILENLCISHIESCFISQVKSYRSENEK